MGLIKKNINQVPITPISDPFYGDYPLKNIVSTNVYRVSPDDIKTTESYFILQKGTNNVAKLFYSKGGTLLRSNSSFIQLATNIVSSGFVVKKKYIFLFENNRCSIYLLNGTLFKSIIISDINLIANAAESIFHLQNNIMLYRSNNGLTAMTLDGTLIGNTAWDYYSTKFYEVSKNEVLITRQLQSSGYAYFLYSITNNGLTLIRSDSYPDAVGLGSFENVELKKQGGLY